MFQLDDYQYDLPTELIAQRPLSRRDSSMLMVVDRKSDTCTHRKFDDLPNLLQQGDILVVNNTAVIPARLLGTKETGGRVEVLLLDYPDQAAGGHNASSIMCNCLVKAAKRPRTGSKLNFESGLQGTVIAEQEGAMQIEFNGPEDFEKMLQRIGHVPLPPYIRGGSDDEQDRHHYQTVYASEKGAVAAPTAGLHFTSGLLDRLWQMGIEVVQITLHVGYGTFAPVRVTDIREHQMHSEPVSISERAASLINTGHEAGRRIIAVGTTSVRSLEFAAGNSGLIKPGQHNCDLFIYPGYKFKIVDAMITNFHLPGSTLLMLVSAFASRGLILDSYAEAIRQKYRFFSYGDAMLIF